jgi:hypothetical protein
MRWLEVIGQLDFDLGVTGDDETFSAESIRELYSYVADLVAGVARERAAGRSLAEIQATPFLEAHASKPVSVDRGSHIAAVYRTVRVVNVEMSAAAVGNYASQADGFCGGTITCSSSKMVPLAAFSFGLSGLRMGLVAEFTGGDQSWHVRRSAFYDEEFAARQSRATVLFRYRPVSPRFTAALVSGVSISKTSIKGMSQQKEAFARTGGRRAFSNDLSAFGYTGGVDLTRRLAGRIDLVIPVRLTHMFGEGNGNAPSRTDVQVGLGFTYGFVRRVN